MGVRTMGFFLAAVALAGCAPTDSGTEDQTFGGDVAFLQKHTEVVVLKDSSGNGQVAVLPAMQGRVMTSTTGGPGGSSFGWINRELIASGETLAHMNPFEARTASGSGPRAGSSPSSSRRRSFDLTTGRPRPPSTRSRLNWSRSPRTAVLGAER